MTHEAMFFCFFFKHKYVIIISLVGFAPAAIVCVLPMNKISTMSAASVNYPIIYMLV